MSRPFETPPAFAKRLGVNVDRVRGWIYAGELKAVNVADGKRPRWRIPPEAADAFLSGRSNRPKQKPCRRRKQADVIGFF